ncbi:nicastrin [Stomoxys calcitrans]|uniref:nicastrin n=1 Tax=Stomoxys calcitrans TaxID=35570 RepID=UPI0027E28E6A|nr:nicastrin [Stomoxys calcitrans]
MTLQRTQVVNFALLAFAIVLQFQTTEVWGKRLHEKIYESFFGGTCFRRLNGTHQTGCSSAESGSVGALHYVDDNSQLDFLLDSPPAPPYAAILKSDFFTRSNLMRLKNDGGRNITAVIVLNAFNNYTEETTGFSHELKCPNQYSGILKPNSLETATCSALQPEDTWNPWGSGLLHEDFPFPIIIIPDNETVVRLIDCFKKFNNFDYKTQHLRSLCAVEIKSFMSAAVNTEVCWRRSNFIHNFATTRYCDPLEGRNVYATLFPRKMVEVDEMSASRASQIDREEKFIMVTTRMDTTGMFEGVYGVGAMDSLTGYTILISVAHTLSRLLSDKRLLLNPKLNILFMIFNGESYDYIGSQRFIYDVENSRFPKLSSRTAPIALENIEYVLDLGTFDTISNIKLHALSEFPYAKAMLEKFQLYATKSKYDFNIRFESSIGYQMPPTSAQSFLRKNISFPATILNAPPSNRFYHSVYDDGANVRYNYTNSSLDYTKLMDQAEAFKKFKANDVQMKIRNVSAVVTMSLYEVLTGKEYNGDILPSPVLIDEILYCFIKSQNCPLFFAASKPNSFKKLPLIAPNRYISVNRDTEEATLWTLRIMGYLLSQKLDNVPRENCTYLPRYWFAGYNKQGECRLTTQNDSLALSPAFTIENYNWSSGEYSTWSESTWSSLSSRLFLRPSRTHEIITLTTGIVVFLLSFCLIYIISTKSEILFEDPGPNASTDALNPPTAC